jgi:chromosome segregation ATPase
MFGNHLVTGMNTTRSLRLLLVRGLLGTALLAGPAWAVSPDELAALRTKAEGGDSIAQHNLGLLYTNLKEATASLPEAYAWLSIAADNGATSKALMLVVSQMSPEQVSDGKRRLEELRSEFVARRVAANKPAPSTAVSAPAAPSTPISAASPVVSAPASPVVAAPPATDPLQNELRKLSAELSAAWQENDQLKASLAKAAQSTTALEELKRERDQLAATVEASTREIANLRAAAANFEGERNGLLQKAAAAANTKDDGLRTELSAANARLKAAENELSQALRTTEELGSARQSLASLNEQVQKLTSENQRLTEASKAASASGEKAAAAEKELTQVRSELGRLQAQLAELTAAGSSSKTQLDATATRLRNAEAELAKATAERAELSQKLTAKTEPAVPADYPTLKAELSGLRDRLSATQQGLTAANSETNRLKEELAKAQASGVSAQQLEDAQVKLESALRAYETQQQEIGRLQKALANIDGERAQLAERLTQANTSSADNARVAAELIEVKSRLKAAEDARAAAESERDSLAQKLAAVPAVAPAPVPAEVAVATPAPEDPELRRQLQETQMKLDAALRTYQLKDEEIDRLQKALANIDGERASLAERIQSATTEASEATARASVNNDATAQLAAVREQLRQAQNQLASFANENMQLKNRLSLGGGSTPAMSGLSAPRRPGAAVAPAAANAPLLRPTTPTVSPGATASAPTPEQPRTHTVMAGDTLTKIAKRYYGDTERWAEILEANRAAIGDPRAISVGTRLRIP